MVPTLNNISDQVHFTENSCTLLRLALDFICLLYCNRLRIYHDSSLLSKLELELEPSWSQSGWDCPITRCCFVAVVLIWMVVLVTISAARVRLPLFNMCHGAQFHGMLTLNANCLWIFYISTNRSIRCSLLWRWSIFILIFNVLVHCFSGDVWICLH